MEGWNRYIGYFYKLIYFTVNQLFLFPSRRHHLYPGLLANYLTCDLIIERLIINPIICFKS